MKSGGGWVREEKRSAEGTGSRKSLAAFQYASERECKNRNCKMCNCKLGWTNAGIASDVSRRLFRSPPRFFFVDFFQLFETAYETGFSPCLSLFSSTVSSAPRQDTRVSTQDPFKDRGRGFHVDFTKKYSASYTNDAIVR